jgi:uncharacterized protein YdeI (YjbR/CyaY-like superfamily)
MKKSVELPSDLSQALNLNYEARVAWKALKPAAQQAHVEHLDQVSSRPSRAKRILAIMNALDPASKAPPPSAKPKAGAIPADFQVRLDRSFTAREEFGSLAKKDQRARLLWVDEAKTPTSRASRLEQTIYGLIKAHQLKEGRARGHKVAKPKPGW